MKKNFQTLGAALALAAVLTACGSGAPSAQQTAQSQAAQTEAAKETADRSNADRVCKCRKTG